MSQGFCVPTEYIATLQSVGLACYGEGQKPSDTFLNGLCCNTPLWVPEGGLPKQKQGFGLLQNGRCPGRACMPLNDG